MKKSKNKLLKDKISVITGAGKGIGNYLTKYLANQGSNVIIISRTIEDLDKLEKEIISEAKVEVSKYCLDVSNIESVNKCFNDAIQKFGNIDVLVNNAGIYGPLGRFEESDMKLWEETIEINLLGAVYCINSVLPVMKKKGHGKIINLAGGGVGGSNIKPNLSAYITSKFAVAGLTECLSKELKDYNIDINAIFPGAINTRLLDQILEAGERAGKEFFQQCIRQKESGGDSLENVGELVAFLASEKSDGITGRLISAKWDDWTKLDADSMKTSLYTLRRIDNLFFNEKTNKKEADN